MLSLSFHHPLDGYYQGTRFDRGGIVSSLRFNGQELCAEWFEQYNPCMHDAVCGPAEEFSPLFPASGHILKIGVGLLQDSDTPYDRFRLYPVLDSGTWEMKPLAAGAVFTHTLNGFYQYRKTVQVTGENTLEISHFLDAERPLEGEVYNHNFFTMGKLAVGPSRQVDFPFAPAGTWRSVYDSVRFAENGVRFSRSLAKGETVFSGDVHEAGKEGMPYDLSLREGPLSIHIQGDVPVTHAVLWANHRIACLEPYNVFSALPGKPFSWTLRYTFTNSA